MKLLALFLMLFSFTACKKDVVSQYDVIVGENSITTAIGLSDDFALSLEGSFDVIVKDTNYGQIFINKATDLTPFSIGVMASLEMFTEGAWEGFEPTSTLPDGTSIPTWITPLELVHIDIPQMNENFDLHVYVGYKSPFYVGVGIDLNFLDDHFPEGLSISQAVKFDGEIIGSFVVYGPTKDAEGNTLTHGGIFSVFTFDPLIPNMTISSSIATRTPWTFKGKNAELYRNNPMLQRQVLHQVKKAMSIANPQ